MLQRCRGRGVSLNQKKSLFCVIESNFLGHIVSQEGVKIDPDKVKLIQQLSLPLSKTGVKSFFGHVYSLRRFECDFS